MASERKWFTVTQAFTANGTNRGKITVADAAGFYVKSHVRIVSNTQDPQLLEVKRIEGTTDIYVGAIGQDIDARSDMSMYLVADAAGITLNEQKIPTIKQEDIWQAIYAREPIVALRTTSVDKYGRFYDTVLGPDGKVRLAVDANVSIGPVTVDIDALTPPNRPDPDNILIAGSEDGTKTGIKHAFVMNAKEQILATHDRTSAFTYADFGTKNQRVTRIDYSSPSIPGVTARRDFNYVLDGIKYRRTNEIWSLI